MSNLKTIKVKSLYDIPKNFTGIVKHPNGSKCWYKDGYFHREDGPAIDRYNGTKEWWINNKRHREDGPAIIEYDGKKYWFKNGYYHREDGPAIEWTDGAKRWYINGIELTEEQHKIIMLSSKRSRQKLYKNNNLGLKNLLGIWVI